MKLIGLKSSWGDCETINKSHTKDDFVSIIILKNVSFMTTSNTWPISPSLPFLWKQFDYICNFTKLLIKVIHISTQNRFFFKEKEKTCRLLKKEKRTIP